MLSISGINNGVVLDHIHAGRAAVVYHMLHLDRLDCPIAIIYNARSSKMGKKDIIKVETTQDVLNLDALAFIDDGITIDYIEDGKVVRKQKLTLPKKIVGVIRCQNPQCITTIEQGLPDEFVLTDPKKRTYRCIYCEQKYNRDFD
ncbi:MAG: aspartate carbamoyltransferase regulatory subunit [Lachnospiraceae bacterium]